MPTAPPALELTGANPALEAPLDLSVSLSPGLGAALGTHVLPEGAPHGGPAGLDAAAAPLPAVEAPGLAAAAVQPPALRERAAAIVRERPEASHEDARAAPPALSALRTGSEELRSQPYAASRALFDQAASHKGLSLSADIPAASDEGGAGEADPGGSGAPQNPDSLLPERLTVIVHKNNVVFPDNVDTWSTNNRMVLETLTAAARGKDNGHLLIVTPKQGGTDHDHYPVASLARLAALQIEGNVAHGMLSIVREARILGYDEAVEDDQPSRAIVAYPEPAPREPEEENKLMLVAKTMFREIVQETPNEFDFGRINAILANADPKIVANQIAHLLPLSLEVKQELLALNSVKARLSRVVSELNAFKLRAEMAAKAQQEIAKGQREYALRQQLTQIRKELGDDDESEVEALKKRVEASSMNAEARKAALAEIRKLEKMPSNHPDAPVSRAYVEWLLNVPWTERTEDRIDLESARAILDRDHSGLEKVKDRIIEELAVRIETGLMKGKIIGFIGPKGVGKTSIAAAIAEAMGRRFVRMSLGGVADEAEIRGHRRTYIGSQPGTPIRKMKEAGTKNPLMLLDEIDKLGRDHRGDPAAALLELLDRAQNHTFRDNYLDVPYDMSEVLFIVTANDKDRIPGPLQDRIEWIDFRGYTTLEKIAIAERHAVPELRAARALSEKDAWLSKDALRLVIEGYTLEAGVRKLREMLDAILRKISAWRRTRGRPAPGEVAAQDVAEYLGPRRYDPEKAAANGVGLATGLAVTGDVGGDTLSIQALIYPGKGELQVTGNLRKVMRESAKVALSLIRANAKDLGVEDGVFQNRDLHIHVPAGAVPKDGPSAGIALATALASRYSGRAVKKGVAMTGELDLSGRVLPIGGLREKVMAAHRQGFDTVLFPKGNEKDLADIPEEVRGGIRLVAVERVEQVWELALEPRRP